MNVDLSPTIRLPVPIQPETLEQLKRIAEDNGVDVEHAANILLTAAVFDFGGNVIAGARLRVDNDKGYEL